MLALLDIGSGDMLACHHLAEQISPLVLGLMKRESIIVSDQELTACSHMRIELPPNIPRGRIFIYNLV